MLGAKVNLEFRGAHAEWKKCGPAMVPPAILVRRACDALRPCKCASCSKPDHIGRWSRDHSPPPALRCDSGRAGGPPRRTWTNIVAIGTPNSSVVRLGPTFVQVCALGGRFRPNSGLPSSNICASTEIRPDIGWLGRCWPSLRSWCARHHEKGLRARRHGSVLVFRWDRTPWVDGCCDGRCRELQRLATDSNDDGMLPWVVVLPAPDNGLRGAGLRSPVQRRLRAQRNCPSGWRCKFRGAHCELGRWFSPAPSGTISEAPLNRCPD